METFSYTSHDRYVDGGKREQPREAEKTVIRKGTDLEEVNWKRAEVVATGLLRVVGKSFSRSSLTLLCGGAL